MMRVNYIPSNLGGFRGEGGGAEFEKEISCISTALDEHNNAYSETPRRVDVL
jgi:hypothetical protein